jgi:hypothetical protein
MRENGFDLKVSPLSTGATECRIGPTRDGMESIKGRPIGWLSVFV